jgi:hypothetical protein
VPDEPADPEVLLGDEDATAGLVDDPDELDDPPDPELAGGAEYRTGVAPPPDPECLVEGRLVCFCRRAVCAWRPGEARCFGPASRGGIDGAAAMSGWRLRALFAALAVVWEPAEPPGDDVKRLAPMNAATPATAMTPAAAISRPRCREPSARRCHRATRRAIARARCATRDGRVGDGGSAGSAGARGSTSPVGARGSTSPGGGR